MLPCSGRLPSRLRFAKLRGMNDNQKLLSVIVPSYNMEEYLPKCLGSLIVPDVEMLNRLDVIVVNDGSRDRTSEIAHDFERRYPGVFRVIDKPNGNYGSCINAALPLLTGWFVKILDADDHFDEDGFPDYLESLKSEMALGDESADMVATDFLCVERNGRIQKRGKFPLRPGRGHVLPDSAKTYFQFGLHSVTYRTSIVRSINYRQTEGISYTDMEWVVEPMTKVRCFSYCPVVVARHLIGREGQTTESAKTIARHYSDFELIASNLTSRYAQKLEECVSTEARLYYKGMVGQIVTNLYESGLFGYYGNRVSVNLREFDRLLRLDPSLFEMTENAKVWCKTFPFRLIHAYRRHPGSGTPALVAYWLFLKVKDLKRFATGFFCGV